MQLSSILFVLGLLISLLLIGCTGGPNVQGITAARYSNIEQFDPLPSSNIGPETNHRPRGYSTQRTEARQAAEQQGIRAFLPQGSVAPYGPAGAGYRPVPVYGGHNSGQYPHVVQP